MATCRRRFSLVELHQRQFGVVSGEDMGVARARRVSVHYHDLACFMTSPPTYQWRRSHSTLYLVGPSQSINQLIRLVA